MLKKRLLVQNDRRSLFLCLLFNLYCIFFVTLRGNSNTPYEKGTIHFNSCSSGTYYILPKQFHTC